MTQFRKARLKYFAICYGGGILLGIILMGWWVIGMQFDQLVPR